MENSSCPHCGSAEPRTEMTGPPEVLRCGSCRLLFLGTFPDADARAACYQEDYYEEGTGARFFKPLEWAIRLFRRRRAADIVRHLPAAKESRQDAILDVGCGRGLLLDCFQQRGWEVAGTQLSETASRACRDQYGIEVAVGELPQLNFEAHSFRAITFYHVLEHVDQPREYLDAARRLLRNDGLLLIEVPDAGGIGFRRLKTRNFCLDYPNHLYFFNKSSLSRAVEEAGFEVVGSGHFSLEYSPFSTLQNLLNALPGKPNRFYRALMRNREGQALRRSPITWLHGLLAMVLGLPSLLLSATSLLFPVGNTLRLYCRPRVSAGDAGGAPARAQVEENTSVEAVEV